MQLMGLLHKTFEDKLPEVHKIRLKSLMTVCNAAATNNTLYLTGLGRSISNMNKESSNIQKVDRLLGNGHLQAERTSFYKIMCNEFDNLLIMLYQCAVQARQEIYHYGGVL